MELHGTNPLKNVIAIIPARYASTRLPGKLLLDIAGRPLILHTLEQAKKARSVSRVIVATDSEQIFRHVTDAGGEVVMTSPDHHSGSDRIAEAAQDLSSDSIVVNVQGDEPMISPDTIDMAVDAMITDEVADIVTVCETITDHRDVISPDVVKVVTDGAGYALYFSRSPIPFPRAARGRFGDWAHSLAAEPGLIEQYKKHCGLYVYRRNYLMRLTAMPRTPLEQLEMLEQLRALENGARIRVVQTDETSIGVDTIEDLERVRGIIGNNE